MALAAGYTNCSQVAFAPSPTVLQQESVAFESTSALRINGGAPYTNQIQVQLELNSPRATDMKISNQADCSDGTWEPYTSAKSWTLQKRNDTDSVYATYKDFRGRISSCIAASIIHDDIAPTATFGLANAFVTKEAQLNVPWTATDNLSGVDSTTCTDSSGASVSCANAYLANGREGSNELSIKVKDKAGNESQPIRFSWLLDQTKPVVVINTKPAAITGSGNAQLGFSGADIGSGIDKFMCQIDQSSAQVCSSPSAYSGLAAGNHTFKVYAIDKVGNTSDAVSAAWTVDTTAPSIRFTQTPAAVIKGGIPVTFGFEGDKNGTPISKFECSFDGAAFAACTSPVTKSGLSEGTHNFAFRGIDDLGNISSPLSYSWAMDLTKPLVTITSAPPALGNSTQATFQWTVSDALSGVKSVECKVDGGGFQPCANLSFSINNLLEGNHTFTVQATDAAGNVGSASKSWTIDLTVPLVTITSAPATYVNSLTAQFSFQATDTSGISLLECRVDNGGYAPCVSPNTIANVLEGSHVFYVRATDNAGNVSLPASTTWTLDLSPPIIRVLSSPVSIKEGDHAVIQYEVVDLSSGLASVRCGMTSPSDDCQSSAMVDLGALPLGSYTYQIQGTDKVGNSLTETVAFQVSVRPVICDPFVVGQDVACNGGLIGDIYYLTDTARSAFVASGAKSVDMFYSTGTHVDALLNLQQLAVTTRDFTAGFPSSAGGLIKDNSGNVLNEYFAFRLNTVLKLDAANDQAGWYQFATLSDDGSMLLIKPQDAANYQNLVANDGDHATTMACSIQAVYIEDSTRLAMQVKYYQGPRTEIAMSIMWRRVPTMTSPADPMCGLNGPSNFYGPSPFQDFSATSGYGKLLANGWRVIAPSNFIAPPQ